MTETIKNISFIFAAGVILFFGVFALRFALRLAWKFLRAVLIILSLILMVGFFLWLS